MMKHAQIRLLWEVHNHKMAEKRRRIEALNEICWVCNRTVIYGWLVGHHMRYDPPYLIWVCQNPCHNEVHFTDLYPELKPSSIDPEERLEYFFLRQIPTVEQDNLRESEADYRIKDFYKRKVELEL